MHNSYVKEIWLSAKCHDGQAEHGYIARDGQLAGADVVAR